MITDWHQTLSRVTGAVINGEERITTHELLTHHLGVPYSDRAARKLRRVMRRLGWRARKIRLGRETRNDVENAIEMTVWTPKFLPPSPPAWVFPELRRGWVGSIACRTRKRPADLTDARVHTLPD